MGLMDQLRQSQQSNANGLLQSILGDQQRITLPNGQSVNFQEFQSMMQGKTPEQGFSEMGLDWSQYSKMLQ